MTAIGWKLQEVLFQIDLRVRLQVIFRVQKGVGAQVGAPVWARVRVRPWGPTIAEIHRR